ncbi:hypothetical protein GCM10023196_056230 [Actinoallomurus vinaceus]|uniref:Uncharacterized protein n=1 Tax=Actinoallomurus vinaceus TaxID=1080074 RepID=A0ABP8UGN3_9ACTN
MSAEAVLRQLSGATEKLEAFTRSLNQTVQNLAYTINSPTVPPGVDRMVADAVITKAKELLEGIILLVAKLDLWLLENIFPVVTGPYILYTAGNKWTTTVFKNLSTVSGRLNTSKTKVDDFWTGPASLAYTQAIPVQKAATDKVAEMVSTTRETIQDLAYRLTGLYVAILAALTIGLRSILVGAGMLMTFFLVPEGLFTIAVAVFSAMGTVGVIYAIATEVTQSSLEKFANLLELKNDGSAFDNGHWPKIASDLGDGSTSDGNRSMWSYKR